LANIFESIRLRGVQKDVEEITPIDDNYGIAVKQAKEEIAKGFNGKPVSYSQPMLADMTVTTPGYKTKPSSRNFQDLHSVLKKYGKNIILNAIINTRSSQVSMYCRPSRYSDKGQGFKVCLKDKNVEPTPTDIRRMQKIEEFLMNTGVDKKVDRDNFTSFCKKMIRDTYRFDQVNFEKVFTRDGKLAYLQMVDPTTIFYKLNRDGHIPDSDVKYVQVQEERVVAQFNTREMAFAVRNPRSDIEIAGYGMPELEVALSQFIAQENTETFNDRFFSHGGTTRGILQIKAGQQQSSHALDIFRREWKSSLSGINGSWQIPVISAEDVKFVNMTPSANDMQFEKWLNYLINVISSLYGIDPAEINFPNNGGATGSRGGSLNEGNSKEKNQASQNKGLLPLLTFIADTINTNIISEWGDKYQFQFVGGDNTSELEKIKILKEKVSFGMTINEARKDMGLTGDILGGDVPMNGVLVQRIGQLIQKDQYEYEKQQTKLNRLLEAVNPELDDGNFGQGAQSGSGIKDPKQKMEQSKNNSNGKSTKGSVGKDGQNKKQKNTNSHGQGGKGKDKDWAKK
jgi:hypothetical protein